MSAALSVKEVAEFARVPVRAVNKAVEEKVLTRTAGTGKRRSRRAFPIHAVSYAAVLGKLNLSLPIESKRTLLRALEGRSLGSVREPIEIAPAVTIDVGRLIEPGLLERVASYARCRDSMIEEDPDVLGGTPVIRDTRISVYSLLGRVEHGDTIEDIIADYPELERETIETAVTYARTHPLIGRPGGRPWQRPS